MASIGEQILAAAAGALDGETKPVGLVVGRSRTNPLQRPRTGTLQRMDVYLEDQEVDYNAQVYPTLMLKMRWRVACRCEAAADPDETMDALYVWARKAVMADPSFGGLAITTRYLGMERVLEQADTKYVGDDLLFETDYTEHEADPESQG